MMFHLHCSSCSSSSYCSSGSLVGEAEAGALEGRTGFSPSALDKQLSLLPWTNKCQSLHLTNTCCGRLFWLHPKIASGKSHKFLSTIGWLSQFFCRFYVLCLTHLGPVCPHRVAPHQSPQRVLLLHKVSSGGFRPTHPSKNSSLSKLAMTRWVMTESYQSCHADSFHGSGLAGKEASLQAFPASGGRRQILTDPIKVAQKTCKANLEVFFAMTFVPSQVFLFK